MCLVGPAENCITKYRGGCWNTLSSDRDLRFHELDRFGNRGNDGLVDSDAVRLNGHEFCNVRSGNGSSFFEGDVPDPYPYESPDTVPLEDAEVFVNEILVVDATGGRSGSFIELLHTSEKPGGPARRVMTANAGTVMEFGTYILEPGAALVLCGSVAPEDLDAI